MEVPCFRCLFMEDLKARACKPADCEKLAEWLFSEAEKLCRPRGCVKPLAGRRGRQ